MLATDLIFELENHNCQITSFDKEDLDISNEKSVRSKISKLKPDILINCAGYTKVDLCESNELTYLVNGTALKYLSEACVENKTKLVHFSTDYIFSGNFNSPISEDTIPNPINKYGQGKLLGEKNILNTKGLNFLIFRIQWLYGKNGKNFVDTILKLSREKKELNVVNDQIGRPTSTDYVSKLILACLKKGLSGIYHLGPKNECSWFDFAKYILKKSDCKIKPISSSEYPTTAKRPLYSVLGLEKINSDLKESSLLNKTWEELVDDYLSTK